jgi:HEAT repeat protein
MNDKNSDSPSARVEAAVARLGEREVVDRAIALLAGFNVGDEFLLIAGGPHAQGLLDGAPPLYWPEVWGARVLLHAWDDSAKDAVVAGLQNQAWRVREMCARVVGTRGISSLPELRELLTDDVARVRAAAARALGETGEQPDADLLKNLFRDPEIDVRRAAQQAIGRLEKRA